MLYHRRIIILAILEEMGGSITAKCLQKYLFLYSRMNRSDHKFFDFVPYKYGCFSFVANNDLNILATQGYISIEDDQNSERRYKLLHNMGSCRDLDIFETSYVKDICSKYGALTQDELIAETYRSYPYTAINSIIKERLLNSDELERVSRQKERTQSNEPILMTLGYEGISLEKYLNTLIQSGIRVLCDVRKNAYSQKYGFCKKTLQTACEGIGIQYVHVPELGIDSDYRKNLKCQQDYDDLFDLYESTILKNNAYYLLEVRKLITKYDRLCLLCFEKDPRQCHRTRIATALMQLPDANYQYLPMIM